MRTTRTERLMAQSSIANGIELTAKIMQNLTQTGGTAMPKADLDEVRQVATVEINNELNNRGN